MQMQANWSASRPLQDPIKLRWPVKSTSSAFTLPGPLKSSANIDNRQTHKQARRLQSLVVCQSILAALFLPPFGPTQPPKHGNINRQHSILVRRLICSAASACLLCNRHSTMLVAVVAFKRQEPTCSVMWTNNNNNNEMHTNLDETHNSICIHMASRRHPPLFTCKTFTTETIGGRGCLRFGCSSSQAQRVNSIIR